MAPPKGNRFWQLALTHGRDRIIQDPEKLWENAQEYFKWCEDNPMMETDFRGKDADEIELPHPRPFTKEGFAISCGVSAWRVIDDLRKVNDEFLQIITRIETIIYEQKFSGAAVGFYNPSIIARDLGLAEKIDNRHDITVDDATDKLIKILKGG